MRILYLYNEIVLVIKVFLDLNFLFAFTFGIRQFSCNRIVIYAFVIKKEQEKENLLRITIYGI